MALDPHPRGVQRIVHKYLKILGLLVFVRARRGRGVEKERRNWVAAGLSGRKESKRRA